MAIEQYSPLGVGLAETPSKITNKLRLLNDSGDHLSNLLTKLEDKLYAVLRQQTETNAEVMTREAGSCQLAEDIAIVTGRLDNYASRLDSIISRIEL